MDETTRAPFEAVLARLLDGEPEPGDGAWLAERLREDPAAAREAAGLLALDDLLRQRAEPEPGAFVAGLRLRLTEVRADESFVRRVRRAIAPPRRPAWWFWPMAAAALFLGFFAVARLLPWLEKSGVVAAAENIAVLTQTAQAEWSEDARQPGQSLAPGWLRLKAGAVQIEFARGARVVLEGPAELQLVSNNEGFLRRGKLRAVVPEPAHGFTVRGEHFAAIDRGTEFGCLVPETRAAEVHVFAGSVGVESAGAERLLASAQAVRITSGQMQAIPARPELFLSEAEFARLEASDASGRLATWRQASAALSGHPAALVHYDFQQARQPARTLPNRAPAHAAPASIIGCAAVEGRWPGKEALEFKRADDRLRFTVPGETASLTLLAWLRVDGLPNQQTSLLMGEAEQPGEVHWYLSRDGRVGFAVIGPEQRWRAVHSPVLFPARSFGAWVCLAVTFDPATSTGTFYFNGRPVSTHPLDAGGPLRLGTVEVGNWGLRPGAALRASRQVADPAGYIRYLQGRVDEFAILSAPLSAAEILSLYIAGRPEAEAAAVPAR